jgi:hypothetical protein
LVRIPTNRAIPAASWIIDRTIPIVVSDATSRRALDSARRGG